jgi:hypothetical protein
MDTEQILDELMTLLSTTELDIRSEPLGGSGGGLCCLKEKYILFLDSQSPAMETAALCAKALWKTVKIENIYLKPELRCFVENMPKVRDYFAESNIYEYGN